jgi:hypothetical protein
MALPTSSLDTLINPGSLPNPLPGFQSAAPFSFQSASSVSTPTSSPTAPIDASAGINGSNYVLNGVTYNAAGDVVDPGTAGVGTGTGTGSAQAVTDFNKNLGVIHGTVGDAINSNAGSYNQGILELLNNIKGSQTDINSGRVQNELAREQGMRGILDMVGNGVRSGGVLLGNNNAGSSSGNEAIARAYSLLGRQQASSVGNQSAQGTNRLDASQTKLNDYADLQAKAQAVKKTNTITGIVTDATTRLTQLNQAAAYASIPERVQIDQEIAQVRQQAMDALSAYDAELTQGVTNNTTPLSNSTIQGQASHLLNAGTAPDNAFQFTSTAPTSISDTGPMPTPLPIFTSKKTPVA